MIDDLAEAPEIVTIHASSRVPLGEIRYEEGDRTVHWNEQYETHTYRYPPTANEVREHPRDPPIGREEQRLEEGMILGGLSAKTALYHELGHAHQHIIKGIHPRNRSVDEQALIEAHNMLFSENAQVNVADEGRRTRYMDKTGFVAARKYLGDAKNEHVAVDPKKRLRLGKKHLGEAEMYVNARKRLNKTKGGSTEERTAGELEVRSITRRLVDMIDEVERVRGDRLTPDPILDNAAVILDDTLRSKVSLWDRSFPRITEVQLVATAIEAARRIVKDKEVPTAMRNFYLGRPPG